MPPPLAHPPRRRFFAPLAAALALLALWALGQFVDLSSTWWRLGCLVVAAWSSFTLLLAVARWLLSVEWPIASVARVVLDEAVRRRAPLAFLGVLLVGLPLLPDLFGEGDPVRYRLRTFLSFGFGLTQLLLAFLTIFLACGTLRTEIEERQIFSVAVKPLGRGSYLIGKWLGVVVLDAVLLTVAGSLIWFSSVGHLARLDPVDERDRKAVESEVLVGRGVRVGRPESNVARRVEDRLETLRREAPDAIRRLGQQVARERGVSRTDEAELERIGVTAARAQLETAVRSEVSSLGPLEQEAFLFEGLGAARKDELRRIARARRGGRAAPESSIRMSYRIWMPRSLGLERVPVEIASGGETREVLLRTNADASIAIPAAHIDASGTLRLVLRNATAESPTISFASGEGLQVLYPAASFESNLLRALGCVLVRLAFLAALSLLAASFLSFPVATLAVIVVFAIASVSPLLAESLGEWRGGTGAYGIWQDTARGFSRAVAFVFGRFSEFDPASRIVDGRLVSWSFVASCLLWIGGLWTGVTVAVGAWILQRSELAASQARSA